VRFCIGMMDLGAEGGGRGKPESHGNFSHYSAQKTGQWRRREYG